MHFLRMIGMFFRGAYDAIDQAGGQASFVTTGDLGLNRAYDRGASFGEAVWNSLSSTEFPL